MKTQVIVIHGGTAFDTYEKYISFLKSIIPDIYESKNEKWKKTLQDRLGENFEVLLPIMPNAFNAKYVEWKIWFDKMIPQFNENAILVGHSLGGIFLAKYLSENNIDKKILATVLLAAPFEARLPDSLADFVLPTDLSLFDKQGGAIFLFHSKDDPVVPFQDLEKYKSKLPNAREVVFGDKKHFNQAEFPELVDIIKKLV